MNSWAMRRVVAADTVEIFSAHSGVYSLKPSLILVKPVEQVCPFHSKLPSRARSPKEASKGLGVLSERSHIMGLPVASSRR